MHPALMDVDGRNNGIHQCEADYSRLVPAEVDAVMLFSPVSQHFHPHSQCCCEEKTKIFTLVCHIFQFLWPM